MKIRERCQLASSHMWGQHSANSQSGYCFCSALSLLHSHSDWLLLLFVLCLRQKLVVWRKDNRVIQRWQLSSLARCLSCVPNCLFLVFGETKRLSLCLSVAHTHMDRSPLACCNSCSWPYGLATQIQMLLTHPQRETMLREIHTDTVWHKHARTHAPIVLQTHINQGYVMPCEKEHRYHIELVKITSRKMLDILYYVPNQRFHWCVCCWVTEWSHKSDLEVTQ